MKNNNNPNNNQVSYEAKDIYVLEGLEPVRKRPGMYIGSTGSEGLHHLIWECVDNSLDEAMAGFAKNIEIVFLSENRVKVIDDGRGIPVEKHPQTKKSALETVMCTLHAGGKFGGQSYKIAGGLHGVGVSVVNALSIWMRVEVKRNGKIYAQEYKQGKPLTAVKEIGKVKKDQTGTSVVFEPDPEIFKEIKFNWEKIINHLRQQAYLTPSVKIIIKDLRSTAENDKETKNLAPPFTFYFEGGIVSFLKYLNRNEKIKHPHIFYVSREQDTILVEAAFQYTDDIQGYEESFANNINTQEGGMHLTGFRTALTRVLNDWARKNGFLKNNDENLTGEDVREGLAAIISIKLREPQFEGQTKAKLGNPEARTAVENIIAEALGEFLELNPGDGRLILEKCVLASKARQAAKAARETVLRKGILEGLALPGKLADCSSNKPEESEIFIVEGDSAGGSAKMARSRQFQAILPLRGKILNIEKTRLDKALTSKEIKSLVIALGTAIGQDFDISKLRYHRIIIMCDADSDGNHIRTLLLTLFFRYFKEIIDKGYLYIAQPPLYRIQKGKQVYYAYLEREKNEIIDGLKKAQGPELPEKKKNKKETLDLNAPADGAAGFSNGVKGINISRYKGLGEMNPEQLWETTMDPEKRILKQVTIEDVKEADRIFDVLMGDEVAPRKRFIQTHAKHVVNLDI